MEIYAQFQGRKGAAMFRRNGLSLFLTNSSIHSIPGDVCRGFKDEKERRCSGGTN